MASHRDLILEQFTRQAIPFSTAPGIRDEEALTLLVEASGATPDDTALDVACGPGLVVCALARVARRVTGIDLTPAMIARARALAREKGVGNVSWAIGEVLPLPFLDGTFTIVTRASPSTISPSRGRSWRRWCGPASQADASWSSTSSPRPIGRRPPR